MDFPTFWNTLRANLAVGDEVLNWTPLKGYLGDSFSVTSITDEQVVLNSPDAKTPQHAYRADFELVHRQWSQYCSGAVKRKDIVKSSRVSKYTISIIKYLEPTVLKSIVSGSV